MPVVSSRGTLFSILLLLASSAAAQPGRNTNQDLKRLLIGTWQQETHDGTSKTEFHSDGTFSYRLHYRIRGGHPATFIEGRWQIQGQRLRMHNESWSPTTSRYPHGETKEIKVEPWTITTLSVIDDNHVRMNNGVAKRIKD